MACGHCEKTRPKNWLFCKESCSELGSSLNSLTPTCYIWTTTAWEWVAHNVHDLWPIILDLWPMTRKLWDIAFYLFQVRANLRHVKIMSGNPFYAFFASNKHNKNNVYIQNFCAKNNFGIRKSMIFRPWHVYSCITMLQTRKKLDGFHGSMSLDPWNPFNYSDPIDLCGI